MRDEAAGTREQNAGRNSAAQGVLKHMPWSMPATMLDKQAGRFIVHGGRDEFGGTGRESMIGRASTAVADTLAKARGDLQWLLRSSESAITGLVASFQGLSGQTDAILKLAAAIVDCVQDQSVSSVLPSVHSLGVAVREFVGLRLRSTAGILETVTAEMESLRKLSLVTDAQAKIALQIKVLNVYTKIEVAHLGAVGESFEYLAGELADFSRSLARNTEELAGHTNDRREAIEQTKLMFSVELPHLREELARIEANLSDDLAVLDSGLTALSSTPVQFRMSAEDIASQIAGVVVAVQGHDITRQQIEHVQTALEVISQAMLAADNLTAGAAPEAARAYAGLTVQIFQLRAIKDTIAEWTSQIRTCMGSILRISASDLVGLGPLVLEQERLMSSQFSHIESLENECQSCSDRIRSTLEGISNLSQLVTEHLQKSESARNRLQLLTFNSIIEASHLGAEADTICVIADRIAEVSVEWTEITEQSGRILREILDLSKRINDAMAAFSQSAGESLSEAQVQSKAGLESLQRASAFAVMQGKKIDAVTDAMRAMSGEVGKTSDLLDACYARIDAVLRVLEDLKTQLEFDHPGVEERYDPAEIEQLFSASYTTQTEREVLRAALFGTELVAARPSSMGNDVELF